MDMRLLNSKYEFYYDIYYNKIFKALEIINELQLSPKLNKLNKKWLCKYHNKEDENLVILLKHSYIKNKGGRYTANTAQLQCNNKIHTYQFMAKDQIIVHKFEDDPKLRKYAQNIAEAIFPKYCFA